MVTLTFCPGFRFPTPTFVPDFSGFGTIVTAFFVGDGFGVGLVVGLEVGLVVGVAVGSCERSLMVTFTFWPGKRLSI